MSTLIGVRRALIRTRIPFSITFTDKKSDTSGLTTVTYNSGGNPSIGSPSPGRVIVICISSSSNSPSSCAVNGNNATLQQIRGSGSAIAAIYYITDVAAGATGLTSVTVTVTYSSAATQSEIGVYRVITSSPNQTPVNANNANFSPATSIGSTLNVPSGGGAIGTVMLSGVAAVTWAATSSLTNDYDDAVNTAIEASGTHTVNQIGSQTFTASFASVPTSFQIISGWAP